MASRFKVRGLAEVSANIRGLPVRLQRRAIRPALAEAAKPMVNAIRRRAPIKTGLTKRSVMPKFKRPRKGVEAIMVGVHNRAYYWRFQELGTSRNAAKPFVRPGFEEASPEALRIFIETARSRVTGK